MARTLLVLEDDDDLRGLLVKFLASQGLETHPARSGPEAIAIASRHKLDLVLADVRMEGMDGLECLGALRQAQPGLKSIVMTGYASDDAPARALKLGADDYVYKPFKIKELLVAVLRVLDKGKEREGYFSLLRNLLGQSSKLARPWEELRALAFQSFFVGVRSRKLTRDEALSLWDELEKLVREEAVHADLASAYHCLIDRIAALSRTDMYVPRSGTNGVEADRFGRFYQRVRAGELSQEQVAIAPHLRLLAPEARKEAPKLAELYERLWS